MFLLTSIGIKLYLTTQLFDYASTEALPIYSISEILALTLFCLFKTNSDCFQCFNRSQEITYSIFQIRLKNSANFDTEVESSEINDDTNILYSSMNSTEYHQSSGRHSRKKNLKRRKKSNTNEDLDQSRNSAYYEQVLLTQQ